MARKKKNPLSRLLKSRGFEYLGERERADYPGFVTHRALGYGRCVTTLTPLQLLQRCMSMDRAGISIINLTLEYPDPELEF